MESEKELVKPLFLFGFTSASLACKVDNQTQRFQEPLFEHLHLVVKSYQKSTPTVA